MFSLKFTNRMTHRLTEKHFQIFKKIVFFKSKIKLGEDIKGKFLLMKNPGRLSIRKYFSLLFSPSYHLLPLIHFPLGFLFLSFVPFYLIFIKAFHSALGYSSSPLSLLYSFLMILINIFAHISHINLLHSDHHLAFHFKNENML
jgi:hypothetical protein